MVDYFIMKKYISGKSKIHLSQALVASIMEYYISNFTYCWPSFSTEMYSYVYKLSHSFNQFPQKIWLTVCVYFYNADDYARLIG